MCHIGMTFDIVIAILPFKIFDYMILDIDIGLGTGVLCYIIL